MGKFLNRDFTKEDIGMANAHTKWCSTSSIIREMHIKTTRRYNFIPIMLAIIKKTDNSQHWWTCKESGTFAHEMNVKWRSHLEKQFGLSLKSETWVLSLSFYSNVLTSGVYSLQRVCPSQASQFLERANNSLFANQPIQSPHLNYFLYGALTHRAAISWSNDLMASCQTTKGSPYAPEATKIT